MKVIKQTPMTSPMLVSTNVVEDEGEWDIATTYAKDDIVYEGILGVYQSLINSNLGHQPSASPTQWVRIAPVNRYAMFDQSVSTQTVSPSPITVVINTGSINSMAFVNVSCSSITVTVRDGTAGPIIYNQTKVLTVGVTNWWEYFFEPLEFRTSAIFEDIPLYSSSEVTVVFEGTGNLRVGELIFGRMNYLGATQYGMTSGIIDYSVKDTDAFGNTILTQRVFRKTINCQLWINNTDQNRVQKLLYELRATPSVWIANDADIYSEASIAYGFYKDFYTEISYPSVSTCKLEIESLA